MPAAVPIVTTILTSINTVITLGRENQRLQGKIKGSLGRLESEVRMAEWDTEKYEDADEKLTLQMQELLCDIDDFTSDLSIPEKSDAFFKSLLATDSRPEEIELIDNYLLSIKSIGDRQKEISKQGNASTNIPFGYAASTPYSQEKDLVGITKPKQKIADLLCPRDGSLRVLSIVGCSGLGKTALARAVYEDTAVMIDRAHETTRVPPSQPTTEIHEVVADNEATYVQPSRPTAFNCKAWVEAWACKDANDLLSKVLNTLDPAAAGRKDTSEAIYNFLLDKRYLVVIDDLRPLQKHDEKRQDEKWKDIKHAFPENCKDSRIIVTTSVRSIARDYSSGSYYVYPMQCLGKDNSEKLFWKEVFGCNDHRGLSEPEKTCSRKIVAKCDGLPVALISAGKYLCAKDKHQHLSDELYKEVCEELDNIVESNDATFGYMKGMFAQCYKDLTDYDHKNCLLYLGIFPSGHQINTKSFIRRLKDEALVTGDVLKCLKKLIDKSMIETSLTRNSCSVAKSCQVQGMILELTLQKSVSRNLVTLVDEGKVRHNKVPHKQKVRRLTVQSSSSSSKIQGRELIPEEIGLSTVRSLTIFEGKLLEVTPENSVNLKSCKMMRVLDLEGCKGLHKRSGILHGICELLLLKHLNLKNTDVDELPTKVKNLKRLETLDIRQTRVSELPVQVIMLPAIAHLFGEFELPVLGRRKKKELTEFLEKSKLETLAGISINNTQGFEIVIRNARKLKKVKIGAASAPKRTFRFRAYFGFSAESSGNLVAPNGSVSDMNPPRANVVASRRCIAAYVSSLQERSTSLDSISIGSSDISIVFLASDLKAYVASSIKLRGPLTSISGSKLKDLSNLKKLHLFSTGLSSQKLVEVLQFLNSLQYLKLADEILHGSWDGDFSVKKDGFPALRDLCFEGAKKYPRMKIAEGAMSLLTSLQLLCPNPAAAESIKDIEYHPYPVTRVEGMEHIIRLDEVILHHTADIPTVKAWENAARMHTNMPCVKKQPKPSQPAFNNAA